MTTQDKIAATITYLEETQSSEAQAVAELLQALVEEDDLELTIASLRELSGWAECAIARIV